MQLTIWHKQIQQLLKAGGKSNILLACALVGEEIWSVYLWHYLSRKEINHKLFHLPYKLDWGNERYISDHYAVYQCSRRSQERFGLLSPEGGKWRVYLDRLYELYKSEKNGINNI